jgi:hypothetical protein
LLQPRGTSSHACSFVPSAAVSHTSCRQDSQQDRKTHGCYVAEDRSQEQQPRVKLCAVCCCQPHILQARE